MKNLFPLFQQHFQFHILALEPLDTQHFHSISVLVLSPLLIYDRLGLWIVNGQCHLVAICLSFLFFWKIGIQWKTNILLYAIRHTREMSKNCQLTSWSYGFARYQIKHCHQKKLFCKWQNAIFRPSFIFLTTSRIISLSSL